MALKAETTTEERSSILSAEEALTIFDREARRVAGMSGEEFLAKWDAGDYAHIDLDATREGRDIIGLWLLSPLGRHRR